MYAPLFSINKNYFVAHLEYYLGLYDDAESSIARALELGHEDDGSMQIRLARIHVRRHKNDSVNAKEHLRAALASFSEAMKSVVVASKAVHYLEVCDVQPLLYSIVGMC